MHALHAVVQGFRACLRGVVLAVKWPAWQLHNIRWWLGQLGAELWIVEGEEQSSGLPLAVLCAVRNEEQNRNYLLKRIFREPYRERRVGRFWLWNLAKAVPAASGGALLIAEFCESHLKFTRCRGWFLLPVRLLGEVELPRKAEAYRRVDRELRRIRQRPFHFEVTRDPRQFDDFYHNMYVPYVSQTFGKCANLSSYQWLKAQFPDADLLLVKDHERTIAGQFILHSKAGPYLWESGIRDGNRDYVKEGAGGALYHFGLQYLQERGFTKAFLGWSRPFLRDGVLQFKRRWSQRLMDSYPNGYGLKILSYTPAAKAFLCNNPFIFKRRGLLHGAVFVAAEAPLSADDIQGLDRDYFYPGLSRLVIYCLGQDAPRMPDGVPAELAARIELRGAKELLGSSPTTP